MSDHLILAEPAIADFVATLFTCILRHGYMPLDLRDCILVPIPKPYKDPTSSDNYRPVALAPNSAHIASYIAVIILILPLRGAKNSLIMSLFSNWLLVCTILPQF